MIDTSFFKQNIQRDKLIWLFIVLTFLLLPVRTAPPLIAIGIAIFIWIVSGKFLTAGPIVRKRWFYPVALFLTLPWIGLLYSKNLELGMDYALKTKYWIALFLTAGVYIDDKKLNYLLYCLWFSLSVGATLAISQYFEFVEAINPYHLGFGIVHTMLSMYLIIGMLTVSYAFKESSNCLRRSGLLLLFLLFFSHLVILQGRNGYFVFLLLSPMIASHLIHKFPNAVKWLIVFLLIMTLFLSPVVKERLTRTIGQLHQISTILKGEWDETFTRPFMVHAATTLFLEKPIVGIGTGSLVHYTAQSGHPVDHPHNNILYMGVSLGFLGIFSYFWLFGKMFAIAWKNRTSVLGNFVLSICLVIFLGGIFETSILNSGTALLLPLGYGMLNHLDENEIGDKEKRARIC